MQVVVKRSFQASWFSRWPWLHYNEDNDTVLCFTCLKADQQKKLQWSSNSDAAFIKRGFSSWKDASRKFNNHQKSKTHEEAVLKVVTLPATATDVAESLSSQHALEKLEHRHCFIKIMSNVKFLARQGLAFRGHGDETDSNFLQLLKLRAEDDTKIEKWLQRKTNKYTSADIQNELMKVMGLHVLRDVISLIQSAPFFSIMVDETTDISNKEQVVLCCRWVDKNLEAHEEFIGLYLVGSTQASALIEVIHDTLARMNISINKLRGQCYDGASSMSGPRSGVATQILQEEPRALYTHCYGHALNLACSDTVKQCNLMRNALDIVQEITKLVKKSPRRDSILQSIKQELGSDSPGLRILCPTRWTVRANALHSISSNYEALFRLWEDSLEIVRETDMRARIIGVNSCMKTFNFFFGVVLGELVLSHSDNLSKSLQSTRLSATEAQKIVVMTVKTLESLRTDENFEKFWTRTLQKSSDAGVDNPELPRRRTTPRRFEVGQSEGHFSDDIETQYRVIYFDALDRVTSCIKSRFDQPGYRVYCQLESLLLKAANNEDYTDELEFIVNIYKGDLQKDLLHTQLGIMACNLPEMSEKYCFSDILESIKKLSNAQKALLSEVCILVSLILVMPATNAVSERSFSSLRRVKNYLRSTMTQVRLNNVMVLHVHKDFTDKLSVIEIGNEFVLGSLHRQQIFGKFLETDLGLL